MVITLLSGVGLYAALFMLAKSRRAARGELSEPSVVQSPRARLFGGIPNAAIGCAYYPFVILGTWASVPHLTIAVVVASACAAATSAVLAYSLLFVTRMPCPYCWTSHAVNWLLAFCNALLLFKISY